MTYDPEQIAKGLTKVVLVVSSATSGRAPVTTPGPLYLFPSPGLAVRSYLKDNQQ